jgi:hypothetical protein
MGGRLTWVAILHGWPTYMRDQLAWVANLHVWPTYMGGQLTWVAKFADSTVLFCYAIRDGPTIIGPANEVYLLHSLIRHFSH